jgi:tRNA(adenine34) deaminase
VKSLQGFIESKKRLKDVDYMEIALGVAVQAKANGDLPIAALLVWAGGTQLIEHDTRYTDRNPLNHAIINVLNKASDTLGRKKISEATLYTNLEPNVMCILALASAGIKEVVFGAFDDKDGFMSSRLLVDHTSLGVVAVGGILGKESCNVLPESMQSHIRHDVINE